jgi:hypothetical protein
MHSMPIDSSDIILSELCDAVKVHSNWQDLNLRTASAIHIAVMSQPFLPYVFAGKKTVESRFSLHNIAPYQKVAAGDIVLMKAGPIVGSFTAQWVKYFDLERDDIEAIITTYGDRICGDEEFWRRKSAKRYVTLIGIGDVRHLASLHISKFDRRAWMTIVAK